jgi:transcriptional regulator with XRE-family HTH domain
MNRNAPILLPKIESRLSRVGEQIRLARLRRNLTATEVAMRSGLSRATLNKIENGNPNVSFGSYCAVLNTLGLDEDIEKLAANDSLGESIEERNTLRKRASKKRKEEKLNNKMDRHALSEARSLAMHQSIAERIKENPEAIISKAKKNIQQWSELNGANNLANAEWLQILTTYPPNKIAKLISSKSEEAYRLRSSSPFPGVLSESEIEEIKKRINF